MTEEKVVLWAVRRKNDTYLGSFPHITRTALTRLLKVE